jgi:hypothetical protein
MMAKESSLSLEGVGKVVRGAGGGSFFMGGPRPLAEADESGRGPKADPPRGAKADPARGRPRGPPGALMPPREP